jgi:cytoskeletal protein RodZ
MCICGTHLPDAIMPDEPIKKSPSRLEIFWPAFAVGVGLLGVLVWTLFLGWLLGHALLAIF